MNDIRINTVQISFTVKVKLIKIHKIALKNVEKVYGS